jgi:RNA polymerase sigma-70 factor (ECF subfamily)
VADDLMSQSDAALMRRVVAGEAACFAELVRRYERPLLRVAHSRLGRFDWAEEAVQEALLSAFRSARTYDYRFSFRTWLWTIVLNECRGHYERRMRRPAPQSLTTAAANDDCSAALTDNSAAPLAQLLAQERKDSLELLLGQLSTVQADALRLRFFAGLKFQEIADTMGCSLNSAKNRVRWGLEHLARLIKPDHTKGMPAESAPQEREA